MFNELTLLADVVERWGQYGAHAEVLAELIAENERLRAAGDALHAWITINATFIQQERITFGRVLDAWEEARRG
jgi:hypothetical protein